MTGGLDLGPLERAAADAGRPGVTARIVPPDRRRGRWLRWSGDELHVCEHVIDRCTPEDARALVVQAVLEEQLSATPRALALGLAGALAALLIVALASGDGLVAIALGAALLVLVAAWAAWRMALRLRADDHTVALLGDPVPLVRALNGMNKDEIHLAGKRLPARPDLHRRAERLAQLHALCSVGGDPVLPGREGSAEAERLVAAHQAQGDDDERGA